MGSRSPRDPMKRKANDLKYRTAHRERRNSYFRKYNVENREAIRERKVINRWDDQFAWDAGTAEWVLATSFTCLICDKPFDATASMKKVMDHNHQTNRFRGVIHNRCNVGIGHLRDSADLCLKAAAYLQAA